MAGLAAAAAGCGGAAQHTPSTVGGAGHGGHSAGGGGSTSGGGSTPGGGGGSTSGGGGQGGQTSGGAGHGAGSRDSFRASIRSGEGRYSGYTGRARIYLRPTGKGLRRPVTITLAALPCPAAGHCLELSGTLTGTLAPSPVHTPDVGHGYLLTGAGSIHPIGQVTVRGGVVGTGFIREGHETVTLTLTGPSGGVTLLGLSGPVSGFTSP